MKIIEGLRSRLPLIYKGVKPLTLEMIENEILDALYPNEFSYIKISVDCKFLELNNDLIILPKILPILEEMEVDVNYELFTIIENIVDNFDYTYQNLSKRSNKTILADTLIIKYSGISKSPMLFPISV